MSTQRDDATRSDPTRPPDRRDSPPAQRPARPGPVPSNEEPELAHEADLPTPDPQP